eukprot:CAMPEP_0114165074 /NCGR_PEP_ID=MMETSP0043_2-20121206/31036_1 /TAXON_ID=464988 /ORGANISM="Hemiselmis andersenii, Strain CCMP644" /LENGTH=602 /DNA_ID=CAMNT_0001261835 /DNA_START=150 /DNA_END=1954 /DNA_ORIENTATION=-
MKRIVFVALGSRGDVQPLAVIAGRMAVSDERAQVAFSSHEELSSVCQRLAPRAAFRPLAAPCFLGDSQDLENPVCVVDTKGRRRQEWIQVIQTARDADLLVCNLFAMPPCIHLADKLSVQLVVCSPSLVPYRLPDTFESVFQQELPDIWEAVMSARTCVSWQDICEWLWPIFTEAHGQFREHFLQLPTIPDLHQLEPPKLFFGIDAMLLEQAREAQSAMSPQGASSIEWSLPSSSIMLGPWYAQPEPPLDLRAAWPFAPEERPVFVTFGSMGQQNLVADPAALLGSLRDALRACGKRGAVQWPTWTESDGEDGTLRRVPRDLSFGWSFPLCCCVVHHGGIGTVSECLRAGIPQVVVPVAYDQPFWGAVVGRSGVGTCVRELSDLKDGMVRALSSGVAERAAAYKGREEEAVAQVCSALSECLSDPPSHPNTWRDDKTLPLRQPRPVHLPDLPGFVSPSSSEAAWVYSEVFEQRVYTPPGIRTWPGMNIVDVGGGAGLFTIFARKVCKANFITLIEPAHESFQLCVHNVTAALGGSVDRISFQECACGADDGESRLLFFPGLPSNSCLDEFESLKRSHIAKDGAFNPDLVQYLTASERRETVA